MQPNTKKLIPVQLVINVIKSIFHGFNIITKSEKLNKMFPTLLREGISFITLKTLASNNCLGSPYGW